MKKRGVAILILAVILTAFMCGCQARDDEGNTPASVLKSGIEAFKNFDDEGLKKYFIDEGLENCLLYTSTLYSIPMGLH